MLCVTQSALEEDLADIYRPGSVLDMPKRPSWNYNMSREKVEAQEAKMFAEYLEKIYTTYSVKDLSYFELNLEVSFIFSACSTSSMVTQCVALVPT